MCEAGAPAHQPNEDRATHRLFTGRIDKQPGAERNGGRKEYAPLFTCPFFGGGSILFAVGNRLCRCPEGCRSTPMSVHLMGAGEVGTTDRHVVQSELRKKAANSHGIPGNSREMPVARLVAIDG